MYECESAYIPSLHSGTKYFSNSKTGLFKMSVNRISCLSVFISVTKKRNLERSRKFYS